MVRQQRLSEEPDATASDEEVELDDWPDDASTATSQDQDQEGTKDDEGCLDVVASNGSCPGSFGNIVVKNSSEVHFGNKTFYQGPVTIKQFLYNNGSSESSLCIEQSGKNNPSYVTDTDNAFASPSVYSNNDKDTNYTEKNISNFTDNDNAEIKKGAHWLQNVYRNHKIITICGSVLLSMLIILLTTLLVTKHYINSSYSGSTHGFPEDSPEQEQNSPVEYPIDPNVNLTLSGKLRIISRLEWVAQPPAEPPTPLQHPVPFVIIMHTATENCTDQASCTFHVRYIQTFHIESKQWWDIGYNFLVGGDGFAYEGRGWKGEGAFAFGYNARAIGIAFIGTFNNILPPERQILAAKQIIELGVKKGYIAKNYKILAHRQLSPTQSPGEKLYENIKTWPHWSATPDDKKQ